MNCLSVMIDTGIKSSVACSKYPSEASGVVPWNSSIDHILPARGLPQIIEAIVGRVAISVVNFLLRPLARHIKPCEAMRIVKRAVDTNFSVTPSLCATGRAVSFRSFATVKPSEIARVRVIMQDFPEFALCDHGYRIAKVCD